MRTLLFLGLSLLLVSCSHTIDFRSTHFASPVVEEKQWGGHVAIVGTGVTKVTVVEDISSNPPTRNFVEINKNAGVADMMGLNSLSMDASLNVWKGLDLFLDGSIGGFRYQFLNHGAADQVWVGAVHGAYANRRVSTSNTVSGVEAKAESNVLTTQAGISLGYKFNFVVPYVSYIHEAHEVNTTVTNGSGTFGSFPDKGTHQNYSVGVASHQKGLFFALEYNMIDISWERADKTYQNSAGAKIGFIW